MPSPLVRCHSCHTVFTPLGHSQHVSRTQYTCCPTHKAFQAQLRLTANAASSPTNTASSPANTASSPANTVSSPANAVFSPANAASWDITDAPTGDEYYRDSIDRPISTAPPGFEGPLTPESDDSAYFTASTQAF